MIDAYNKVGGGFQVVVGLKPQNQITNKNEKNLKKNIKLNYKLIKEFVFSEACFLKFWRVGKTNLFSI